MTTFTQFDLRAVLPDFSNVRWGTHVNAPIAKNIVLLPGNPSSKNMFVLFDDGQGELFNQEGGRHSSHDNLALIVEQPQTQTAVLIQHKTTKLRQWAIVKEGQHIDDEWEVIDQTELEMWPNYVQ